MLKLFQKDTFCCLFLKRNNIVLVAYFAYAIVGKLLIFLWQQFPLSNYLSSKWKPLQKLFSCDLCLGVWIYWFLALFFEEVNPFMGMLDKSIFALIFTSFLTGALTSFLVH